MFMLMLSLLSRPSVLWARSPCYPYTPFGWLKGLAGLSVEASPIVGTIEHVAVGVHNVAVSPAVAGYNDPVAHIGLNDIFEGWLK